MSSCGEEVLSLQVDCDVESSLIHTRLVAVITDATTVVLVCRNPISNIIISISASGPQISEIGPCKCIALHTALTVLHCTGSSYRKSSTL